MDERHRFRRPVSIALLSMIAILSACARSPVTSFYVLSATPATSEISRNDPTERSLAVVLRAMPSQLVRPEIVVQLSDNRVSIEEHHRWAGRLDKNILDVIVVELARRAVRYDVHASSLAPADVPAYRIFIDIKRLDLLLGVATQLDASWQLVSTAKPALMARESTAITVPMDSETIDHAVASLNRAVGILSAQIADFLSAASSPR